MNSNNFNDFNTQYCEESFLEYFIKQNENEEDSLFDENSYNNYEMEKNEIFKFSKKVENNKNFLKCLATNNSPNEEKNKNYLLEEPIYYKENYEKEKINDADSINIENVISYEVNAKNEKTDLIKAPIFNKTYYRKFVLKFTNLKNKFKRQYSKILSKTQLELISSIQNECAAARIFYNDLCLKNDVNKNGELVNEKDVRKMLVLLKNIVNRWNEIIKTLTKKTKIKDFKKYLRNHNF